MAELCTIESPLGPVTLTGEGEALTRLDFGKRQPGPGEVVADTPLLREAAAQVADYFAGKRKDFDLPLAPKGTPFQQRAWQALCTIPYGQTISYKELAQRAGSPKGYRAVGMANNRNPIAVIIPCHRVIGADGSLTGYGSGLDKKRWLLELEGVITESDKQKISALAT